MNPITIPNISIPSIGIPTIGIPSVGFPSASGGGGLSWPAGMKEHIKAWYDPKKQGMTNYDVIESYVTDFTTWRTADKNYVGLTIRSSSFSISFNKASNHVIMWKPNYLFNEEGQVKLQVSGITNNISIIIKHGTQEFPIVNGVNTFSFTQEENKSLSFVCKNVFQDTNITITQLPTSILKDFSGNGNHAYLYGGKGKLNSGMGVYKQDYTTYKNDGNTNVEDVKPDTFVLLAGNLSRLGMPYKDIVGENIPAYKINVTGITDGTVTYFYRNEDGKQLQYVIKSDGEYELPTCYREGTEGTAVNIVANNNSNKITITQIPDYPDQLCYDGKMYAVCYGFPILTDYTVMAERTWFESGPYCAFISNRDDDIPENRRGAFVFEQLNGGVQGTSSFGSIPSINFVSEKISWQTKESYNGKSIGFGSNISSNPVIVVGAGVYYTNSDGVASYANLCHGAIIIADRSFTEEEINWLKQNWDKI